MCSKANRKIGSHSCQCKRLEGGQDEGRNHWSRRGRGRYGHGDYPACPRPGGNSGRSRSCAGEGRSHRHALRSPVVATHFACGRRLRRSRGHRAGDHCSRRERESGRRHGPQRSSGPVAPPRAEREGSSRISCRGWSGRPPRP
jgi:hypothetical protein